MAQATAMLVAGAVGAVDDFPVDMAWCADSAAVIVGGGEGRLVRVLVHDGSAQLLGVHAPGLLRIAVAASGTTIATAGQDGAVRLWEGDSADPADTGRVVHQARHWPAGLCMRMDAKMFAFASGKDVVVCDAQGQVVRVISGHSAVLAHLEWRGRDELIAAGNGALFVDRVDTGAITAFELEGAPTSMALSPDLKIVANGLSDGTINFRYLNLRKRSRMSGYEGKVAPLAWSANSRYLASASTGASSVVVWDFGGKGPEGSEPQQYAAHDQRIESLAWQPRGVLLASAGRDCRAALWRTGQQNRKPLDVQLLDGPAGMMCWSPDGKWLAVSQESGTIRFFSLKLA